MATIGLAIAVGVFVWRLFVQIKRHLLWRVRRKLILSYIFIGVIPSLLILVFFLFAGSLLFVNVSAYLFKDGYDGIVENARVSAQAAATEIDRDPSDRPRDRAARAPDPRSQTYPNFSIAYLPPEGRPVTAGRWSPLPAPDRMPAWLKDEVFAGSLAVPVKDSAEEEDLRRPRLRQGRRRRPRRRRRSSIFRSTSRCCTSCTTRRASASRTCSTRVSTGRQPRAPGRAPAPERAIDPLRAQPGAGGRHDWAAGVMRRDTVAHPLPGAASSTTHLSSAQSILVERHALLGRAADPAAGHRRDVPDHRGGRAGHGPGARAVDHQFGARAVHGHRAGAAGGLHPPHQHRVAAISSASWPTRSTR